MLFFPFSSFEIREIKEININNEIIYEIKLFYLGKYLKEFIINKAFIENEKPLPKSNSKKKF